MLHTGSYSPSWKNVTLKKSDDTIFVSEYVLLSLFWGKTPCAVFSESVDFTVGFGDSFLFTFTGKELDAETGFSYFGARYLDHTLTTAWLSVDPMADKYPSISPYAYCAWNPLKLVDPDGEWPWNPKHIRAAKRYARKTHGTLSVWNNPYGVQFASVSYTSLDSDGGKIFSYALFQPEGYSVHGTIRAASGLSDFELWLESPSESTDEIKSKTVLSFFYGIPNDVCKLVTGHTIAGSEVNSSEKTEAFVSNATSFLGFFLKSSKVITKVSGLR